MATSPPIIESVALTPPQKRGRIILALFFGMWLVLALGIDALLVAFDGPSRLLAAAVRLLLSVGLFYAVWVGKNWARWLTVGLFGFAFALSVRHFVIHHNVLFLLFTLFFFVVFSASIFVLTISKSVTAFLNHQRSAK